MKRWQHTHLFFMATSFWAIYFLAGLPSDYYQQWHWMLSLLFVVFLPSGLYIQLCLRLIRRWSLESSTQIQPYLWCAFYFTLPLFLYDSWYLGWHQARGWTFIITHWYLSIFYALPWLWSYLTFRLSLSHQ